MTKNAGKKRAPRNRTLTIDSDETIRLAASLLTSPENVRKKPLSTGIAHGDFREWCPHLPTESVDLLFLDPPYNLSKSFGELRFSQQKVEQYTDWLRGTVQDLLPLLKDTATIYICGDWRTSHSIYEAASEFFILRNRITWEREKGRGAKTNWKNCSEDIWFCTMSGQYYFDPSVVKLRRQVVAPYKHSDGSPKDWQRSAAGSFRDTHPSNLWTDISIPFWSMPENTDHPTQKSEKLLAKLILASSQPGDFVLDPFVGSGTSVVVAKKLGRQALGMEINREYCLWAQKRLEACDEQTTIQGYEDGVFWERNTAIRNCRHKNPK